MKNKILLGVTSLLMVLGLFGGWNIEHAIAVSDTCTTFGYGVPTDFTASFPTSVVAGQSFSVTNITSTPSASYGVTVTSSSLSLSATNASQTTYTNNNTSTNPSPTTGAPTYTGYYPNWSLTSTGAAGSQITIKLVQASATVAELPPESNPLTCPLIATLATINITAPPPTTGGTNNTPSTTPQTPQTATSTSTKSQKQKAPTTAEKKEEAKKVTETKEESVEDDQIKASALTIIVNDKNGQAVKGASVTVDNQLTVETSEDGTAVFDGIRIGEHQVTIAYGGQRIEQTIQVSPVNDDNKVAIIFPTKSYLIHKVVAGTMGVIVVMAVLFVIRKRIGLRIPFFDNLPKPLDSLAPQQSPSAAGLTSTLDKSPMAGGAQVYSPEVIKPQVSPTTAQQSPHLNH